jgi:hypothetical protein
VAGAFVEEEACGLEPGPEEDIVVCKFVRLSDEA